MPGGFGFPSSYRSAEICCFTPRIKTHASTTVRFWIYIGRGWVPLGGGRPPPPGSPSPLPARGPPASPPPPRSGGGGPEGVARGFSGKTARVAGGLAGWLAGGGTPGGGVRDATAGVRPREREAQWVGRSRLRVRELIPPAALFRGPLSVLSLRLSPPGVSVRPSVRLSVCPSLERLLLGGAPLPLLSPRSVRGCGGSTGWVLWQQKKGVSWCGSKKAAAPEGVGRDCRSDLGAGVAGWSRSGRSEGLAGAGRRAGRGPGAGCAWGVPSEGGVRRGGSKSRGKRPRPLSLSLRFVFSAVPCRWCALHLALGAICRVAVVGSTLADSDSVSSALPCPRRVRRRPRVTYSGTRKASAGGPADCIRA